jgi:hypothetical protein
MRRLRGISLLCFAVFFALAAGSGCASEPDSAVRQKLEKTLVVDLSDAAAGIAEQGRADTARYVVENYQTGYPGRYSAKAEVNFFVFKSSPMKIFRKYRYHTSLGLWECYLNELRFVHDTTNTPGK